MPPAKSDHSSIPVFHWLQHILWLSISRNCSHVFKHNNGLGTVTATNKIRTLISCCYHHCHGFIGYSIFHPCLLLKTALVTNSYVFNIRTTQIERSLSLIRTLIFCCFNYVHCFIGYSLSYDNLLLKILAMSSNEQPCEFNSHCLPQDKATHLLLLPPFPWFYWLQLFFYPCHHLITALVTKSYVFNSITTWVERSLSLISSPAASIMSMVSLATAYSMTDYFSKLPREWNSHCLPLPQNTETT